MTEKEKIDQIHEQQSALYQFYFEENRYERPIWCSNCGQEGHKANACRKPKVIYSNKCFVCFKKIKKI